MSVEDYTCAAGCGKTAVAVVIMGNGFYGECAEHLKPLGRGDEWLWAPVPTGSEVDELFAVADDYEADVLEALRRRAGHIWGCPDCNWSNLATVVACDNCGQAKP